MTGLQEMIGKGLRTSQRLGGVKQIPTAQPPPMSPQEVSTYYEPQLDHFLPPLYFAGGSGRNDNFNGVDVLAYHHLKSLGIMNNYVWSDIMNAHGTAMAKWNLYNGPRDKDIHDTSNFQLWRTAEWIHWFPGTNHFNLASRRTALDYLLLMVLNSVSAIRDYAFLDWESNDTVRWL